MRYVREQRVDSVPVKVQKWITESRQQEVRREVSKWVPSESVQTVKKTVFTRVPIDGEAVRETVITEPAPSIVPDPVVSEASATSNRVHVSPPKIDPAGDFSAPLPPNSAVK